MEAEVDRVVLLQPLVRIYHTRELSQLARTIAAAEQLALDRTLYGGKEGDAKCKKCIETRMAALTDALDKITSEPHDLSPLDNSLVISRIKSSPDCKKCSEENYFKLVDTVKATLKSNPIFRRLSPKNYDEVFSARAKPFFIEGLWNPPPRDARLIESYGLSDGRGRVNIYEQRDHPVPFYELVLPEFNLPADQLEMLDSAYRFKIEEAPGHARFAYSTRTHSFAEEWYHALLHMLREKKGSVPAAVRKLAELMASWLTYRLLEPFSHDDHITDIFVPAPPEIQPIYVEHERWGRLETGIYWTTPALLGLGETLASRLGTSFDEIRPQLDAEIPELGMRLFLSRYPAIWTRSVEIAVRKRRSRPWTQPLFLERGTLSPLASSFLGNVLRLGSSAFVIGEMGTAKTSQVETYVPEIGPHNRIVAFQDTEELHIEDFISHGYKLANVRVSDPEQLERQVNAFLRGGPSYWLITEVRAAEAVRAALGAAARQGSQPVVASFHARSKMEMFDLIVHIMGLHPATFKYIDFIISTARFTTPSGTVRRIVEISEVLKDWKDEPKYSELFVDDRKRDKLIQSKLLSGPKGLVKKLNSSDLSSVNVNGVVKAVRFLPPEKGGSQLIPRLCRRLAIDEEEFLASILAEAKMKSELLMLARKSGDSSYLELPFVSRAYNAYFYLQKQNAPNYSKVLEAWRAWLKRT
ncbi:MAG: ATPase, T2SS/T4P/T4SS family [Candidatus Hadarchaeum sp.]|uniref:ATPase, T2SS/T4P/T4SS family n=1 Tax=Candidatus Hadarchaeum sp. TaxID=2883567 RepID=UPI003D0ED35B